MTTKKKTISWVNNRNDNQTLKNRIDELEKRIQALEQELKK
jgi:polyhydroxyalkanoate synthesis regulator phasin